MAQPQDLARLLGTNPVQTVMFSLPSSDMVPSDYVLPKNQILFIADAGDLYFGDGVTAWASLPSFRDKTTKFGDSQVPVVGNTRFLQGNIDYTGNNDSTSALNAEIAAALALGQEMVLLPGTIKVQSGKITALSNAHAVKLRGCGPRSTVIQATDNTGGFIVKIGGINGGDQGFVASHGWIKDLTINGPVATPPTNGGSCLLLQGAIQFSVENVECNYMDIGFDAVANNYGAQFTNIRAGFGGTCNVGMNMRVGYDSGSDINIVNPWLSGRLIGLSVSGGTSGIHVYGGQLSAGQTTTVYNDNGGSLVMCRDYTTGTLAECTVNLHGVSFEGCQWVQNIRTFGQCHLEVYSSFFNPTQVANPAAGVIKCTGMANARVLLSGIKVGGYYTQAQLVILGGSNLNGPITEIGTYVVGNNPKISVNPGVNSGTPTYFTSLMAQSALTATAGLIVDGNAICVDGMWLKPSNYNNAGSVLQYSLAQLSSGGGYAAV